jgi:hypothetical protein
MSGASPVGYIPLQLCEVEVPFRSNHTMCQQSTECSDQQKLEIIVEEESVCSEDSGVGDPDMIYNRPFECVVDNCGELVDHTKTRWTMNHFLQNQ